LKPLEDLRSYRSLRQRLQVWGVIRGEWGRSGFAEGNGNTLRVVAGFLHSHSGFAADASVADLSRSKLFTDAQAPSYNAGAFCCLHLLWRLCVGHLRVCRTSVNGPVG
jgi:hypothetical protein